MDGSFTLPNLPFNRYHLTVTMQGFSRLCAGRGRELHRSRSRWPSCSPWPKQTQTSPLPPALRNLVELTPTEHTDVDRRLFEELPLESQSSSVSSLITLASPGVAADSNGLFHGLGDHAENSFSVDGQPITDQQSKVFSNQIPVRLDSIPGSDRRRAARRIWRQDQRGRQGHHALRPGRHARRTASSPPPTAASAPSTDDGNLAYGGPKWGNFISVSGLNTGRFLDRSRIHGAARQRQRGEFVRPLRLQAFRQGHAPIESGIHAFLVSKSQYLGPATSNLHGSVRGLQWRAVCPRLRPAQPAHRHSSWGRPISARKSAPLTSRPPGRA